MSRTYTVRAEKSGGWWAVTFDRLPGAYSQARQLRDVEGVAREAIALMEGVTPDLLDLRVIVVPEKSRGWDAVELNRDSEQQFGMVPQSDVERVDLDDIRPGSVTPR